MQLDHYTTEYNAALTVFRFTSTGSQGAIIKLVQFSPTSLLMHRLHPGPTTGTPVYNLGFGDLASGASRPDDTTVSANGDRDKVLATVAGAAYMFCHHYPDRWVYATGSTPTRTRLYQMSLNRLYAEIVDEFDLFGYVATTRQWEVFKRNGTYAAFLIRLKPITT